MTETNISTARVPQVTVIDPRIPEKAKLRVRMEQRSPKPYKGGDPHDLYHW